MDSPATPSAIDRFAEIIDGLCAVLIARLEPRTFLGMFFGRFSRPMLMRMCDELRGIGDAMRAIALSKISEIDAGPPLLPQAATKTLGVATARMPRDLSDEAAETGSAHDIVSDVPSPQDWSQHAATMTADAIDETTTVDPTNETVTVETTNRTTTIDPMKKTMTVVPTDVPSRVHSGGWLNEAAVLGWPRGGRCIFTTMGRVGIGLP